MMTGSSCRRLLSVVCAAFLTSTVFGATQDSGSSTASLPPSAQSQLHLQLEQAQKSVHQGDLAAATESLHRALAIDPHSLLALNELAIVLSRQGKPAEAIPLYQQALKLRPDDPVIRRNPARFEEGKPQSSATFMTPALARICETTKTWLAAKP